MEKITSILACAGLAVMLVGLGFVCGQRSARVDISKMETTTHDTLWTEVHDTCWKVESVKVSRIDTVRLAYVPDSAVSGTFDRANGHENGISGTHPARYGYENAVSGTYTDTLFIHDSVFVEIPIERKTFTGDNYRITAHGYAVGLDDVWINRSTIYVTKTNTKTKRWAFNVGAQIGYGYTVHGASPYVGIGAGFGYTF